MGDAATGGAGPRSQLEAWLRRTRPARVLVRTDDGERTLLPRGQRGRWARLAELLAELDPDRCEAVDRDGHVVGVWRPDAPATTDAAEDGHEGLALLLRAQERAVADLRAVLADVVASYRAQLEASQARLAELERSHHRLLERLHEAMLARAEAEAAAVEAASDEQATELLGAVVSLAAERAGTSGGGQGSTG